MVRTYAERIDNANHIAGSWTAQWTVAPSGELKGTVTIQAYCHEGGTTQLSSTRDFGPTTTNGDIVKHIRNWEQEVVDVLAQDETRDQLKMLRRVMPLSRTRMDWNVLSHRMVKMLADDKE